MRSRERGKYSDWSQPPRYKEPARFCEELTPRCIACRLLGRLFSSLGSHLLRSQRNGGRYVHRSQGRAATDGIQCQCGGIGWTGAKTCSSGWTCTVSNPYYSQCQPSGSNGGTSSNTTTGGSTTPSVAAKIDHFFTVHFYDRRPAIFAHLSNGNMPRSYKTLNGGKAILVPTLSTKAVLDGLPVAFINRFREFPVFKFSACSEYVFLSAVAPQSSGKTSHL